jgi:hypothetical protein
MRKATGNPQRKRISTRTETRNKRLKLAVENGNIIKELLSKASE